MPRAAHRKTLVHVAGEAFLLLLLFCGVLLSVAGEAEVRNERAARDGNRMVIDYDLVGEGPVAIDLRLSLDGGTFARELEAVVGDVGRNVAPGSGKRIVWDALQDFPRGVAGEMAFEVVVGVPGVAYWWAGGAVLVGVVGGTWVRGRLRFWRRGRWLRRLRRMAWLGWLVAGVSEADCFEREWQDRQRKGRRRRLFRILGGIVGANWVLGRLRELREGHRRRRVRGETFSMGTDNEREQRVCPVSGMEFVVVPGGSFDMGDTFGDGLGDEQPVHRVAVSAFLLAKTPVTKSHWKEVMFTSGGGDEPRECVSWDAVQLFLKQLKRRTGKDYRLPTEAEWEYAARSGGKEEKWAGTSEEASLDGYAWYQNASAGAICPVAQKAPNGLGLCDMSGNVREWCEDDWHGDYRGAPRDGRAWIDTPRGEARVVRGGSWCTGSAKARAASRTHFSPEFSGSGLGFRVALSL